MTLPPRASGPALTLFCFPPAGSDGAAYRRWAPTAGPEVHVVPIVYRGRGRRWGEAPFTRMAPLVMEAVETIRATAAGSTALFGHSLGALVAFEVARALRPAPEFLAVSACPAPSAPQPYPPIHTLPDDRLITELAALGATPPEALADPELMQLVLPTIRADLEVGETYAYEPGPPLATPLLTLVGDRDPLVSPEAMTSWGAHTTAPLRSVLLRGDHDLLDAATAELLDALSSMSPAWANARAR